MCANPENSVVPFDRSQPRYRVKTYGAKIPIFECRWPTCVFRAFEAIVEAHEAEPHDFCPECQVYRVDIRSHRSRSRAHRD